MESVWQWVAMGFGVFAVIVVAWFTLVYFAFKSFVKKFDDDADDFRDTFPARRARRD